MKPDSTSAGPEFLAQKLDIPTIREAIQQYSCAVVRNVFNPTDLAVFHQRALLAFQVRDWLAAHGELSETYMHRLHNYDHILINDLDLTTQDPLTFAKLFATTCLPHIGKGLLGENMALILNFALPRRQRPPIAGDVANPVPFHQDATFTGDFGLILNFWIPLVPCGITSPGLEVVPVPVNEVLPTTGEMDGGHQGIYRDIDIAEERIAALYGRENFWHPALNLGDIMILTHKTLHRTYMEPGMTQQRISVEMRCGDISLAPEVWGKDFVQFPNSPA
jgi:hypothetical protein